MGYFLGEKKSRNFGKFSELFLQLFFSELLMQLQDEKIEEGL